MLQKSNIILKLCKIVLNLSFRFNSNSGFGNLLASGSSKIEIIRYSRPFKYFFPSANIKTKWRTKQNKNDTIHKTYYIKTNCNLLLAFKRLTENKLMFNKNNVLIYI